MEAHRFLVSGLKAVRIGWATSTPRRKFRPPTDRQGGVIERIEQGNRVLAA